MAPKNDVLSKIERKWRNHYDALFQARIAMIMQVGQDAGCFAANDVFHAGEGRAPEFCLAYRDYVNEIVKLIFEDQNCDKEFVYSKAKIDERLEKIVGKKNFCPFDERYGL